MIDTNSVLTGTNVGNDERAVREGSPALLPEDPGLGSLQFAIDVFVGTPLKGRKDL
jgi:hypothetical protein